MQRPNFNATVLREDLTVLIFSRNRENYLTNLINYLSVLDVKVLILDGSDHPMNLDKKKYSRIDKWDSVSLRSRLSIASSLIDTRFTCILGDDDLIPLQSLVLGYETLTSTSLASICTTPREFNSVYVKESWAHGDYVLAYSTEEEEPCDRLNTFLSRPLDRQFYGFFNSLDLCKALRFVTQEFTEFNDDEWIVFFPFLFEVTFCIIGKSRFMKEYIYLKRCMEDPKPFSKKKREFVNNIHAELRMDWNSVFHEDIRIFHFVDKIIGLINEPDSLEKELLSKRLVESIREKVTIDQSKGAGVKAQESLVQVVQRKYGFLYFFSRAFFRAYMWIKMGFAEGRRRWDKVPRGDSLYLVASFARKFGDL